MGKKTILVIHESPRGGGPLTHNRHGTKIPLELTARLSKLLFNESSTRILSIIIISLHVHLHPSPPLGVPQFKPRPRPYQLKINLNLQVRWAEQLFEKARVKRYFIEDSDKEVHRVKRLQKLNLSSATPVRKFGEEAPFNDELWVNEWYLVGFFFCAC